MKARVYALAFAAVIAVAGFAAFAQMGASGGSGGYLTPQTEPDATRLLPPPPAKGSTREADDQAVFIATRALQGQPRWSLAAADVDMHSGPALYACALGVALDAANAPTVMRLFGKIVHDTHDMVEPAKAYFARPRPYLVGADPASGPPICEAKTPGLAKSPAYPSGHSTLAWSWGLVLAELAPDRATDILMRARSIGESRVVCGVHYVSDVEAGRTDAAMLIAALHGDPGFRADMDLARAEVAAARHGPARVLGDCSVETAAARHAPY